MLNCVACLGLSIYHSLFLLRKFAIPFLLLAFGASILCRDSAWWVWFEPFEFACGAMAAIILVYWFTITSLGELYRGPATKLIDEPARPAAPTPRLALGPKDQSQDLIQEQAQDFSQRT